MGVVGRGVIKSEGVWYGLGVEKWLKMKVFGMGVGEWLQVKAFAKVVGE